MKWLYFVWRSATRSHRRSLLIILSLAATFFLFATLRTALTAFESQNEFHAAKHRVFTQHAFSLLNPLPRTSLEVVRAQPGVAAVCGVTYFAGFYKDDSPENLFPQFAADTDTLFDVWSELDVPEEQRQAYRDDPAGCLVHQSLLDQFKDDGWQLGHEVPLLGGYYPIDLRLTIRGVIQEKTFEDALIFHWDHLDAANNQRGVYTYFISRCRSAADMAPAIEAIDRRFENSEVPTRSMTEAAFNESFAQMLGDVTSFIQNLTLVLLVVMVLAAANAIALATRERIREIAVLKTLGFTPGKVRWLILQEACLISLCGGLLGCGGAWLLWRKVSPPGEFFLEFQVAPQTVALGVAMALVVGVVAGMIPAHRAARLPIIESLRR